MVMIATITGIEWLHYSSMPLVMIWIAANFMIMTKPQPNRWLVMTAFFFSWVGDVFLMFGSKNDLFFFAGVGGFFIAQVTYIIAFSKFNIKPGKGFIAQKPLLVLPYLAYVVVIYSILYPHLEGIMKPVVALYAISLMGMSAVALNRKGLMDPASFRILFTGTIFFMISDSILALNKFAIDIPQEGLLVLSTYVLAQFLIMQGLIKGSKS
jgi:uncharacterized membrane protein YhhN